MAEILFIIQGVWLICVNINGEGRTPGHFCSLARSEVAVGSPECGVVVVRQDGAVIENVFPEFVASTDQPGFVHH